MDLYTTIIATVVGALILMLVNNKFKKDAENKAEGVEFIIESNKGTLHFSKFFDVNKFKDRKEIYSRLNGKISIDGWHDYRVYGDDELVFRNGSYSYHMKIDSLYMVLHPKEHKIKHYTALQPWEFWKYKDRFHRTLQDKFSITCLIKSIIFAIYVLAMYLLFIPSLNKIIEAIK